MWIQFHANLQIEDLDTDITVEVDFADNYLVRISIGKSYKWQWILNNHFSSSLSNWIKIHFIDKCRTSGVSENQ